MDFELFCSFPKATLMSHYLSVNQKSDVQQQTCITQ